ncbi:MAG: hypothetical protein EHM70_23800 [Chloroflexota bacterium]|nr:MAG: hypothetical protein EHM70_23800 [Chloroflexota bacterium]
MLLFAPACTAPTPVYIIVTVPPPEATSTLAMAPAAAPLVPTSTIAIPALTPVPPASPTGIPIQLCSPLEGVSIDSLEGMISNPFHPPASGSDDPHHGVDFSDVLPGSQVALAGRQVQAVLGGQVAAVMHDRFPYGNAVII